MVRIIFIDDNYLYKNFPLPQRMDRASLLSIIQLEQFTSTQDLLGTCLYEDLEGKVYNQTLTPTEEGLFKLVKYSLSMYAAKSAISILRSETSRTKREETNADQYVLDTILSTIESKLAYINKRVVEYIKADTALYGIATADGCDNDVFDETDTYNSTIYYPKEPINKDCNAG